MTQFSHAKGIDMTHGKRSGLRLERVLSTDEIEAVMSDLHRRGKWSRNSRLNDVVFRLSTICGLRASEIASVRLCDVRTGERPTVHVVNGKGNKRATVAIPDVGTVHVFDAWMNERKQDGAKRTDPFVAKIGAANIGKAFNRNELAKRFKTACRCLGPDRLSALSIHDGRHSAATQLLRSGHDLATVRDFLRHSSLTTTSLYLHGQAIEATEMYPTHGDDSVERDIARAARKAAVVEQDIDPGDLEAVRVWALTAIDTAAELVAVARGTSASELTFDRATVERLIQA